MLIGYISNEMNRTTTSSRQEGHLKTRGTIGGPRLHPIILDISNYSGWDWRTPASLVGVAGPPSTMDVLPDVMLLAALELLDVASLRAFECTSRHLRNVVHTHGVWERMTRRGVLMSADDAPASVLEWKRLAHLVASPIDSSTTLLDGVTDCSSYDRATESPENTLTLSPCWISIREQMDQSEYTNEPRNSLVLARRAQRRCTCSLGHACYWSSTPSAYPAKDDFIEYLVSPQSLVQVVQAIPYRAFWQPRAPTYCPRAASLQFHSINRLGVFENEPLYESPMLPLENKMKLNEFKLPHSLWLPQGGIMRLKMYGRQQAQTLDPGPIPEYYTCISYVSALGSPLVELMPPQVDQQTDTEGKQ